VGFVLLIFLVFCFVCFVFFLIVLCLVSSVAYVYGLSSFVIALCLVSSVACVYGLSSLVCDRSVSCAQCCQCLWIVQSSLWSLCILCPVLPMSMNCAVLFVIALYLVTSVANVYGLSSLVCNRSVSCAQYCQCLWIVQSCLRSFCILYPVLSMSMDCPVLFVIALYLVFSIVNVYELCSLVCDRSVSCAQCCQCLWIVQSSLWSLCILCPMLPMSMNCPV
jgi:hypothetical protein